MTGTLITRRRALAAISSVAAAIGVPRLAATRPLDGSPSGMVNDRSEPTTQRYQPLAEWLAVLELEAIQRRRPHWQSMFYNSGQRWPYQPNVLLVFGVGPADLAGKDRAGNLQFFASDDSALLGEGITPCGRSWAFLVRATVSDDLAASLPRPEWRRAGWEPKVRALVGHFQEELAKGIYA